MTKQTHRVLAYLALAHTALSARCCVAPLASGRRSSDSLNDMRGALKAILLVLALPAVILGGLLVWFSALNFPFTSGVVAHTFAPSGEELCVVQTFKGAEPYQVSLYARRPGQAWAWNYLAHQDARWRVCRVDFSEDKVRVYRGSALARELSLAAATDTAVHFADAKSAEYSPKEILSHHDRHFRL